MNMKKNLIDEIKRIHEITYGGDQITESTISDILARANEGPNDVQKVDVPYTADYVSNDVNGFFDILKSIDYPIFQQRLGSMQRQTQVEAVQIALLLLGYKLPVHGVDGLFGPETAAAVNQYKKDNNIDDSKSLNENQFPQWILIESTLLNEAALMEPVPVTAVTSPFGAKRSYENHPGVDLRASSGTPVKSPAEGVVLKAGMTNGSCGGSVTIKHGADFQSRYCHLKQISVSEGQKLNQGDVIGLSGGNDNDPGRGNSHNAHLHFELKKGGQLVNPMNYLGKGGYDFTTTQTQQGQPIQGGEAIITVDMVDSLINQLKTRNIESKDLDRYIDKPITTGGGALFTDANLAEAEGFSKYAQICDKFIKSRGVNPLQITGNMLAKSAREVFINPPHKYVPPELALSQLTLEGGIGNGKLNSRPIKTKNPFNVGNTYKNSKYFPDVQSGIDAYYKLIANNYMTKGRTANDLIQKFVNKDNQNYVGSDNGKYEQQLVSLAKQVNRVGQSMA